MAAETLKAPGRSLDEWLCEISQKGWTGRLDVNRSDGSRSLFFVAGDLYLSPDHPVFDAAAAWVKESDVADDADEGDDQPGEPISDVAPPPFQQLAGPILSLTAAADREDCVFELGAGQIPLDLAGPLPTKQLIMELAVFGLDEQGLLHRLGGDRVALQARSGVEEAMIEVQLQPGEGFLLSRMDSPMMVNELISQLDLSRNEVLRSLCRLQAVGLVVSPEQGGPPKETSEPKELLLNRFERRIASSLEERPLEIERQQHRELVGSLLGRMGEMTYFEMLAVTAQSTDEDIHQAYSELGRLVHPSHAEGLGLGGKEGAFRVLFERATDAYLTLNDPERRLEYLREIGPSPQLLSGGPSGETRDQEKQEVARENYERALNLADRQDYHSAIQLLEQAVKVDPQAEYLTLLGDCQAENPQWLERAAFNYRKALQVRPGDPSISTRLGRLHERQGDTIAARKAYQAALTVAPEMESAKTGLWRVDGEAPNGEKVSLAERLKRFLRGGR